MRPAAYPSPNTSRGGKARIDRHLHDDLGGQVVRLEILGESTDHKHIITNIECAFVYYILKHG